jgi:hypothetical protein
MSAYLTARYGLGINMETPYEKEQRITKLRNEVFRDERDLLSWFDNHGDKNPRQIVARDLLLLMWTSKRYVENTKILRDTD